MSEAESEDAGPPELAEILQRLPLRVALAVPADLAEAWFAPGSGLDPLSDVTLQRLSRLAEEHGCEWRYEEERMEVLLWKWVPAL